jgi:hypothetical protein
MADIGNTNITSASNAGQDVIIPQDIVRSWGNAKGAIAAAQENFDVTTFAAPPEAQQNSFEHPSHLAATGAAR